MTNDDLRKRLRNAIETSPSRKKIRKIYLFGSHLHGDAKPGSDIDLIIEVERPMGLFEFAGIKVELEEKLGTSVDLVEPGGLSKYIKDDVLREAEQIYTA